MAWHVFDTTADNMATEHPVAMPPANSSPADSSATEPGAEGPGYVPHGAVRIANPVPGASRRKPLQNDDGKDGRLRRGCGIMTPDTTSAAATASAGRTGRPGRNDGRLT